MHLIEQSETVLAGSSLVLGNPTIAIIGPKGLRAIYVGVLWTGQACRLASNEAVSMISY